MISPYLFEGTVLPERAQISLKFGVKFKHLQSDRPADAYVSIINNKVLVTVTTEVEWSIFDLRNVVRYMVRAELAIFAFLKGYVYDLDVFRVTNGPLKIDYIFGVDTRCIVDRNSTIDLDARINALRSKILGQSGILLSRCLNDLVAALKEPEDTGFYCYRALESLRHHCRITHNIDPKNKGLQWTKLRELASCEEATTRKVEDAAKPGRHGDIALLNDEERVDILMATWGVVEKYVEGI